MEFAHYCFPAGTDLTTARKVYAVSCSYNKAERQIIHGSRIFIRTSVDEVCTEEMLRKVTQDAYEHNPQTRRLHEDLPDDITPQQMMCEQFVKLQPNISYFCLNADPTKPDNFSTADRIVAVAYLYSGEDIWYTTSIFVNNRSSYTKSDVFQHLNDLCFDVSELNEEYAQYGVKLVPTPISNYFVDAKNPMHQLYGMWDEMSQLNDTIDEMALKFADYGLKFKVSKAKKTLPIGVSDVFKKSDLRATALRRFKEAPIKMTFTPPSDSDLVRGAVLEAIKTRTHELIEKRKFQDAIGGNYRQAQMIIDAVIESQKLAEKAHRQMTLTMATKPIHQSIPVTVPATTSRVPSRGLIDLESDDGLTVVGKSVMVAS